MEWKEALPLLQENHTGVAISVTPNGRAQKIKRNQKEKIKRGHKSKGKSKGVKSAFSS
jgi:hypothetical protein